MAEAALNDPQAHLYGPVLGLPALRAEIAAQWSAAYGGTIAPAQVGITQGCNQAFTAVMATLAGAGDEVILPTPWYFNHKMWLDMQGVGAVPLPTGPGLIPRRTGRQPSSPRAPAPSCWSAPTTPAGRNTPPKRCRLLRSCPRPRPCADRGRNLPRFRQPHGRPHDLFTDPDWADTLIHLYSFSKAYRLTGHRVGAIVASTDRLAEVEKFLDTVAICPSQLGQIAALWGMRNLAQWVAGERAEILARRAAMTGGFAALPGWRLLGCGAYFAYVEHPFDMPSDTLAKRLVHEAAILMLPGTMFQPATHPEGARQLRIAFANATGIAEMFSRLAVVRL
jgi:aspartate/methionine/tyrosine aminotransferase